MYIHNKIYVVEAGGARQQTSTQTLTPNAIHKHRANSDILKSSVTWTYHHLPCQTPWLGPTHKIYTSIR